MKKMVCIVCPRGCHLSVSDGPEFVVTGNACPRGAVYGKEEATDPRRMVTATCPLEGLASHSHSTFPRRVPVRTTSGIPKDRVGELATELCEKKIALPVKEGQVIIENWKDTGVSVIATRSLPVFNPDNS